MSAEATGWVWRNSPYTGAQLLVHLAIADVVNDVHENELWMSVGAIAKKAKVARSTVSETLLDMCGQHLMERLSSGKAERKPSRYRFLMTSPLTDTTSPESGHRTQVTQVNPIVSSSPESGLATRKADKDCPRCLGRGTYYNGGGGFDVVCPCTERDERAS